MARKAKVNGSKPTKYKRGKYRRVRSLAEFLHAYGRGSVGEQGRRAFAKRLGTSVPYLTQLAYGYRAASTDMAIKVERATHGLVRVEDLRPDLDWAFLAMRAKRRLEASA